jgi:hypothetical protein
MFRAVFWVILPCKIIVDRRFRGAYCLHHQGWRQYALWNDGRKSFYTAVQPRRQLWTFFRWHLILCDGTIDIFCASNNIAETNFGGNVGQRVGLCFLPLYFGLAYFTLQSSAVMPNHLQCRQRMFRAPHCWASRSPPHTSLARVRASATRLGTRQQVWHNYPSPPLPIIDLEVCSLDIHDPLLPSLFALPVSLKARLVAVCHIDRARPPAGCPDSGPEEIPKGRI